jgi:hypothetical protein
MEKYRQKSLEELNKYYSLDTVEYVGNVKINIEWQPVYKKDDSLYTKSFNGKYKWLQDISDNVWHVFDTYGRIY